VGGDRRNFEVVEAWWT